MELAQDVDEMPVHAPERWFQDWRGLFSRQEQLSEKTSSEISHIDALEGWTAANVIRRFPLTEGQEIELNSVYDNRRYDDDTRSNTIRWRVIHAMAAIRSREGVELLLNAAAEDGYPCARYGAIRSLMEVAAREIELRESVLEGLRLVLPGFNARERIQLVRSARQRVMAEDWCQAVRPLLQDVPQGDLTEREQANLRNLLNEFDEACA
jgi:hypothetical protein